MSLQDMPERSSEMPVGVEVIITNLNAIRDPQFNFETLPTYHPDAVRQRNEIQANKTRQVSHYRMMRRRWWEVFHYERVEEDTEKRIAITVGSEFEHEMERTSTLTAKMGFELGYSDIVKITGEIESGLELRDRGAFKQSINRTEELSFKLKGGHYYFFWQIVEAIRLKRVYAEERGQTLVSEIIGRSSETVPVRVQFREDASLSSTPENSNV